MKTKYWIGIVIFLLAVSLGMGLWLLRPREPERQVLVILDGQVVCRDWYILGLGVEI